MKSPKKTKLVGKTPASKAVGQLSGAGGIDGSLPDPTASNPANSTSCRSRIIVPPGWTPERDRKCFDSCFPNTGGIGRRTFAMKEVNRKLRVLDATVDVARSILIRPGGTAHAAAAACLPVACKVILLADALYTYPPPNEEHFFEVTEECLDAVAETERILMKCATHPEAATLWELLEASEWLESVSWHLEECFWINFQELDITALFKDLGVASDGEKHG